MYLGPADEERLRVFLVAELLRRSARPWRDEFRPACPPCSG